MEQAILALLGISITLTLYLDRGRRADVALLRSDNAQLRRDMESGFKEARADNAKLRQDVRDSNAQIREEMRDGNTQIRKEMNDGLKQVHSRLDKLTDVVMDLCRRVGRLEGRIEASDPKADTSQ